MERAVSLAENNQARLTVVDVLPPLPARLQVPGGGDDLQAAMVLERLQMLQAHTAPHQQRLHIEHEVLVGTSFLEIIRSVLRGGHDLLMKPAENPSVLQRLFGSDDMHLLRKCPCPLWLTGPEEKADYGCIVAAVDFDLEKSDVPDALNEQILALSASLALSDFAALHLVHAWEAPGELMVRTWSNNPGEDVASYVQGERARHQKGLDALRERLRERLGAEAFDFVSPQFHLRQGSAVTVIPELAKQLEADLVVMGTVARTGIAGLLIGNTAESILEQLQCSVLAVKPAGFVTPVAAG